MPRHAFQHGHALDAPAVIGGFFFANATNGRKMAENGDKPVSLLHSQPKTAADYPKTRGWCAKSEVIAHKLIGLSYLCSAKKIRAESEIFPDFFCPFRGNGISLRCLKLIAVPNRWPASQPFLYPNLSYKKYIIEIYCAVSEVGKPLWEFCDKNLDNT